MVFKEKDDSGSYSEWNEGDFKNLRLHESQELINIGKMNPFSYSENGTTWNYETWHNGIDILYGEGKSKYSPTEKEEVETVKKFVETFLSLKPPFKNVVEHKMNGKVEKFIPIPKNQEKIRKILESYEEIVKKFNDDHGLSTRNRDSMDDGL